MTNFLGFDEHGNRVEIFPKEKRQQSYIIGTTGTGKSTLIENMVLEDIRDNVGVCVIDPKRDLIDSILSRIPADKLAKVVLLDVANTGQVFGLNLYEVHSSDIRAVQERVEQVMQILELLYDIQRTNPLISQTVRNASYTLIANNLTFAELPFLLTNPSYRRKLLQQVTSQQVRLYWQQFEQKNKLDRDREIAATLNKFDELLQPMTLSIVGQQKSTISFGDIMDQGKILLVKLDSRMPYVTSLVGSLLVTKLLNATYDRESVLEKHRKQFNVYIDEFGYVAFQPFENLFDQARGYGVTLTAAHQTRTQLTVDHPKLARSVLQARNLIVFRLTGDDAKELSNNFSTTPEVAWVEEEEAEWFERVEEDVIDGDEEITTPVKDVVGHLLRGGSHPSPVVNQFSHDWLPVMQYTGGVLPYFNELLYHAMIGDPLPTTYPQEFFYALFTSGHVSTFITYNLTNSAYNLQMREFVDPASYHVFLRYWLTENEADKEQFYSYVKSYIRQVLVRPLEEQVNSISIIDYSKDHADKPSENDLQALEKKFITDNYYREKTHRDQNLLHVDVYSLGWERGQIFRYVTLGEYHDSIGKYNSHPGQGEYTEGWVAKAGQEYKCIDYATVDRLVEEKFEKEVGIFEQRIADLKDVMDALAEHPLTTGSGIRHPRKRKQINYHTHPRKTIPHPQRTRSDMQGEIAERLVSLPNFTASVRLASGEHQVTIEKSNNGISHTELMQRIADIVEQNVKDGYLRYHEDVEKEIRARYQPPAGTPPETVVKNQQQQKPALADLTQRVPPPAPPLPPQMGKGQKPQQKK